MEADDLVGRVHAAASGDRVLVQDLEKAIAVEEELRHNAWVKCFAMLGQYLADKHVGCGSQWVREPGSASSMQAVVAQTTQNEFQQASFMLEEFLASRAQLWSAQVRALVEVSELRQQQLLQLKHLQEYPITIPLEQQQQRHQQRQDPGCQGHQQQQITSEVQDAERSSFGLRARSVQERVILLSGHHEPGCASSSLLLQISGAHQLQQHELPQQHMGSSSSMEPFAAPEQATTNITTAGGKGSAAIRRAKAFSKPKVLLAQPKKECKKRKDLQQ